MDPWNWSARGDSLFLLSRSAPSLTRRSWRRRRCCWRRPGGHSASPRGSSAAASVCRPRSRDGPAHAAASSVRGHRGRPSHAPGIESVSGSPSRDPRHPFGTPSAANSIIRASRARPAPTVRDRFHSSSRSRSPSRGGKRCCRRDAPVLTAVLWAVPTTSLRESDFPVEVRPRRRPSRWRAPLGQECAQEFHRAQ